MTRAQLGNLTFIFGLVLGALLMRVWLGGNLPFLPSPPTPPAQADGNPGTDNASAAETLPTATPIPTATPLPTPTATLEPISGPTPAFGGLTLLENGWLFTVPEKIINAPDVRSNGIVNLVGESGTVYRLNPDGTAREEIILPEFEYDPNNFYIPISFFDEGTITVRTPNKIYAVNPDGTLRWEFPLTISAEGSVLPEAQLGDLFLQLDSTKTLFAYTLADGLLWQYTFENGFREDFYAPAVDAQQAYFVDITGLLYAFSAEGLTWTLPAGERLRAASAPIIAPDGNVYYMLTDQTKGFLQSVTPTGEQRWTTELTTFLFYTLPDYTVGGQYIFVKQDLVRADTGELAPVEFPYEVNTFIRGDDGADYLLTGDNIIRWQIGPEGYESLHTVHYSTENIRSFSPPLVRVYASQITEIRYFVQNGMIFVWLNPDGEVMNTFTIGWKTVQILPENPDEISLTLCDQSPTEKQLICKKYVPGSQDPVWETVISDMSGEINVFGGLLIRNGQLFAVSEQMNLYVINLELP